MQVIGDLFPNGGESYSIEELLYIIRLHICIHLRKIKFIFNEIDKSLRKESKVVQTKKQY